MVPDVEETRHTFRRLNNVPQFHLEEDTILHDRVDFILFPTLQRDRKERRLLTDTLFSSSSCFL